MIRHSIWLRLAKIKVSKAYLSHPSDCRSAMSPVKRAGNEPRIGFDAPRDDRTQGVLAIDRGIGRPAPG
jgi:hypothetical protein